MYIVWKFFFQYFYTNNYREQTYANFETQIHTVKHTYEIQLIHVKNNHHTTNNTRTRRAPCG